MEKMIPNRQRTPIALDNVQIGDVVYISDKVDAVPYQVLDKGTPFILIENMRSHFANLYRPTILYKEI